MKTSRYTNNDYCISFGENDVAFVKIEVDIKQLNEMDKLYEMKIVSLSLITMENEFAAWLCSLLTEEQRALVNARLREIVTAELTPSLFTLFYVGDITNNE